MKEYKLAATLQIKDPSGLTKEQVKRLSVWLREIRRDICRKEYRELMDKNWKGTLYFKEKQ